MEIDLTPYDRFKITGTDFRGRRNPPRESTNALYLQGFNYYTKTFWGRDKKTGKWKRLYRVIN